MKNNFIIKRVLPILLVLTFVFALASCGDDHGTQECIVCKKTFEAKEINAHTSADGIVYLCDDCMNPDK